MEKAAQKIQSSTKLRIIVIYLAVITTLAVFTVGYNQNATCNTQQANVEKSNARNMALDSVITEQVKLYKVVKETPEVPDILDDQFDASIATLEESRQIIKDTPSTPVKCFIVG